MVKKRRNNSNKVNVKARINRHLRIGREIGNGNKKGFSYGLSFVLIFVVFLFPIYPGLANAFYRNTEIDFYRGDIDESSIINSYVANDDMLEGGEYINNNVDAFVSVDTILEGIRNTEGSNEILIYTVKSGESYQSIAAEFGVSVNSILWANNFSSSHVIHPGDEIKVPPVTGLVYTVKKGDSVEAIAGKYKIDTTAIEEQNGLAAGDIIKVGQVLMLPGAEKIIPPKPKPVPAAPSYTPPANNKPQNSQTPAPAPSVPEYNGGSSGKYQLVRRAPKWKFYWGNCTRYVGQYKNVTWGGNANMWMNNARAQGYATGQTPKLGAIIQFSGRGYNPRYGHVGIVMEINGDNMIVSDMNYRRINEVTYRSVSIYDRAIDGYIYVD